MPIYDECILTVDIDENGVLRDAVADCRTQSGKGYVRRGIYLDGMYMYTELGRANIIKWAKASCK